MAFNSIRPVFSLVNQEGQAFTNSDLHGKYSLVFFGFTNCAVVCPRALKRLSDVLAGLGPAAERVNVYYISVDPARDTPGVMKNFITKRFPKFIGLTGTKDQIDSARKEFHVFAKAKHDANALGGYVVPHTAITYLLDMEGYIVDHFNDVLTAKVVTARVLEKIKNGPDVPTEGVPEPPSPGKVEYEQESLKPLDVKMVQSIRHIGNLARQLKGDWANMMGASDLNDGFGAYRYQLAFMYYALSLAHFHRLPAAPGYFRETMERMIKKMLEPDVWFYWHDASTGGGAMHTPPKPMLFDPIETDNIMYSAYLQVMTAMYNSLYDDDRYQEPGALTFKYNVFLWGPPEGYEFVWDQNKVNDQIYRNMVKEGYLGVACEPWCIYQVCNQVPILGFRLNDALKEDSDVAGEVTKGYVEAWETKGDGIITDQGVFNTFYMTHLNMPVAVPGGSGEAWTGFMMNAWNHDLVQKNYESRLEELLFPKPDGSLSVNVGPLDTMETNQLYLATGGVWGWIAAWATEMGDDETKDRLLSYADKHFNPRVQNGGLMYPRNDTLWDKDHNYVMVSPILSNAILPLTRLNVKHGLKRLYENPWGAKNRAHYDEPALVEVDFNVDVYRAVYIASSRTLLFDVAVFENGVHGYVALGRVFGKGNWTLSRDGHEIASGTSDALSDPSQNKGLPRIRRGGHNLASPLGWAYMGKTDSGLKQEGDLLRLSVTGTKVVSYELKWDA
jgi:cytochrome oxidase Cu insertion factor (SCO1/SenC/PrrC family)